MRTIKILLLFVSSIPGIAQNWCPDIGARWWHTYDGSDMYGTCEVVYTGDSTIEGEIVQRLTAQRRGWVAGGVHDTIDMPPLYTARGNDMVRIWTGAAMDTVFMLGRAPGTRWNIPFMGGPCGQR